MECKNLIKALEEAWCYETAYHGDRKNWSENKKEVGQCTVTAMVVYDYLGGEIQRGYSNKYELYHYWNVVNGEKLDCTYSQFFPEKADIEFSNIVRKKKADLMKIKSVRMRYQLLKEKVDKILN